MDDNSLYYNWYYHILQCTIPCTQTAGLCIDWLFFVNGSLGRASKLCMKDCLVDKSQSSCPQLIYDTSLLIGSIEPVYNCELMQIAWWLLITRLACKAASYQLFLSALLFATMKFARHVFFCFLFLYCPTKLIYTRSMKAICMA